VKHGVFPGSFDPLTVAHLGIADAAVRAADLDRLHLAVSRVALGKGDQHSLDARVAAIQRAAVNRPWLGVFVTDDALIVDIAQGYDVVVMGADKWAQIRDPAWYGGDASARDAALVQLPRVLVAPRPGFDTDGAEELDVPPELTEISSTRARAGEHHLIAPEARRRVIVDGNNVIGSRPDGWWRDLEGAARRLVQDLQAHAARTGDRIAVVLDGRPLGDLPEGVHERVLVTYARRAGRDAADDRIVEEVERDADPASLVVVTSDRALAERVRALGAHVEGARSLSRGTERR
jgi:nicotinic acid mononucleotide adenylyltransferase/predicted RNA-binding protein with PIN domain